MKKFLLALCISLAVCLNVQAKEKITVYVFTQEKEEVSTSALKFFKELKKGEYGKYFNYKNIEVWDNNWNEDYDNRQIADKVASYFKESILGAPYIVIGNKYSLSAFSEDKEEEIIEAITKAYNNKKYEDLVEKAKKEIKAQKRKDALAIVSITSLAIVAIGGFILVARKNND